MKPVSRRLLEKEAGSSLFSHNLGKPDSWTAEWQVVAAGGTSLDTCQIFFPPRQQGDQGSRDPEEKQKQSRDPK